MWHIGQKVECVESNWVVEPGEFYIPRGMKLEIREILPATVDWETGLKFVDIINPLSDRSYSVSRNGVLSFRPIQNTDISVLQKLIAPKPVKILEDA